jgi:hypothetical protein
MNLFRRLFGKSSEAIEAPPEFLQAAAPDWLIEAIGRMLPDGGHFSIRTQIFNAARTATVDLVTFPVGGEPASQTRELERAKTDRLLVILGFSYPHDIADVPGPTDTGLPVAITVFRREPLVAQRAECNLWDWLESPKPAPPVVEIGKILVDFKRRNTGTY